MKTLIAKAYEWASTAEVPVMEANIIATIEKRLSMAEVLNNSNRVMEPKNAKDIGTPLAIPIDALKKRFMCEFCRQHL